MVKNYGDGLLAIAIIHAKYWPVKTIYFSTILISKQHLQQHYTEIWNIERLFTTYVVHFCQTQKHKRNFLTGISTQINHFLKFKLGNDQYLNMHENSGKNQLRPIYFFSYYQKRQYIRRFEYNTEIIFYICCNNKKRLDDTISA